MKTMRLRLKELTKTMNENKNKAYIKSDEYAEMQVEFDCINVGIGYLNIEIKRTIVMLKICLYKQRVEKSVSITKSIVVASVNKYNDFNSDSEGGEKSTIIDEYKNSETNFERKRKHITSIHHSPPSKIKTMATVNSINNELIGINLTNQESSKFIDGEDAFHGRKESTNSGEFTMTGHVLILFVFLLGHHELSESEKIKCKMRRLKLFLLYPS